MLKGDSGDGNISPFKSSSIKFDKDPYEFAYPNIIGSPTKYPGLPDLFLIKY
jgi:hypothetical protein